MVYWMDYFVVSLIILYKYSRFCKHYNMEMEKQKNHCINLQDLTENKHFGLGS